MLPLLFMYLCRTNHPWHCSKSSLLPLCNSDEGGVGKGRHREGKGLEQGHAEDEWQRQKQSQVSQAPVLLLDLTMTVKHWRRAEFQLFWVLQAKHSWVILEVQPLDQHIQGSHLRGVSASGEMLSGWWDGTFLVGQNTLPGSGHRSRSSSGSEGISMVWFRSWHWGFLEGKEEGLGVWLSHKDRNNCQHPSNATQSSS